MFQAVRTAGNGARGEKTTSAGKKGAAGAQTHRPLGARNDTAVNRSGQNSELTAAGKNLPRRPRDPATARKSLAGESHRRKVPVHNRVRLPPEPHSA